jgi:Outer membrane protein and related peptidoglycan-associated (lipo)proteins
MSNDIISAVENELTPEFIDNVSTYLQEDKASVLSAFSDIIPYVLNKVCSYLEHREQQGELLSLIHNAPEPDLHTMPLHSVLKKMELNGVITEFFSMIMPASVTETQFSGIMTGVKSGVKSSYFSLAALLLLKQMKRYLQSRTGQSVSLKQWLMTSQHHVVRSPDVTPQHQMNAKEDLSRKTGKKGKGKWLLLLLLLLLLLAFIGVLRSCTTTSGEDISWTNRESLGAFFDRALPDGKVINIPEKGIENKLLNFVVSDQPVSDNLWFSFDRLSFKTNSAELQDKSREQLDNIAEIMTSYPNVKLKLGGYTDNTGTDDFNNKLSQERADAVRQELTERGIAGTRLEAKGYGSLYPVAPNDTEENRAKNRRIDIQVTQK